MPILAALTGFLLLSGPVIAAVSAPDCLVMSGWNWTFNSLNQNPCVVAAFLQSTCNIGSFTVDPLPRGHSYYSLDISDAENLCKCNTVTYSLLSACSGCQGGSWLTWSQFSSNCTSIMLPSTWVSRCGNDSKFEVLALTGHSVHSFPNPVPVETRVPQWAFLDVTIENYWNSNKSSTIGDNPEITSPSTSPSPSGRSASFYGTIAGAVGGGIALIAGIAILWGIHLRRRHSKTQSSVIVANSAAHLHIGSTNTLADDGTRESSLMPGAPPVIVHVCCGPSSTVRRDSDSSSRPPSYRTMEPETP